MSKNFAPSRLCVRNVQGAVAHYKIRVDWRFKTRPCLSISYPANLVLYNEIIFITYHSPCLLRKYTNIIIAEKPGFGILTSRFIQFFIVLFCYRKLFQFRVESCHSCIFFAFECFYRASIRKRPMDARHKHSGMTHFAESQTFQKVSCNE